MDAARLVERAVDEFVAGYAVQHWLDVTARRKTVAIRCDLEPFDKRTGTTQQAYEQAFAGRESPDCGRFIGYCSTCTSNRRAITAMTGWLRYGWRIM